MVTQDRNEKAESAEKEGRKEFWVHEIKHDGFRLMLRPAALFCEMTLVDG
jgi:ATP-dependent DNA ligase